MMAKCKTRGSNALKHCYKELEMLLEDDKTQTLGSKTFFLYYQNIKENSLPSQQDRVLSMCASHIICNLVKMADVAGETYP